MAQLCIGRIAELSAICFLLRGEFRSAAGFAGGAVRDTGWGWGSGGWGSLAINR